MKYLLAMMALQDPARFVRELGATGDPGFLRELWTAVGLQHPAEQRVPADALGHDIGEIDGAPYVCIRFPAPHDRNEAIAMVFVLAARCRVFALERAEQAGGAMLVEIGLDHRDNWGPASSDPAAVVDAVRVALASTAGPVTSVTRR
ncbi:MAG: hypothetical protein R3B06_03515 [Kofleriaceae bacterium]